jgi:aspartyl-tRNA synthetase
MGDSGARRRRARVLPPHELLGARRRPEQRFGGMLHALSLGAPPHGGIAPGIDRIVMLLCGEENLREVVLFPVDQRAEDLMMGAPLEVLPKQLREPGESRKCGTGNTLYLRVNLILILQNINQKL